MDGKGITGWHRPSFNPADAQTIMSHNMAQLGAAGNIYYVSLFGSDSAPNDGSSWARAFRTIIHAIDIAVPYDTIIIGPGIFDETANGKDGVIIDKQFLYIYGSAATKSASTTYLTNSNAENGGSTLTFTPSAYFTIVENFAIAKGEGSSSNAIIAKFDGAIFCALSATTIFIDKADRIGLQFTNGALGNTFSQGLQSVKPVLGSPLGYIAVDFDDCTNCAALGDLIFANCHIGINYGANVLVNGTDRRANVTNCTIGAQISPGAIGNVIGATFTNCVYDVIDNSGNGTNERPSVSLTTPYAHEDLWPNHLGQGLAASPVTITNLATDDTPVARDDENFWGNTVVIIAPNTIAKPWFSNGINLFSGVANKIMLMEFYYPQIDYSTARNGGNPWYLGETILTVQDGTVIQNDDKVWITSTGYPNGEILLVQSVVGNVVTIASETRASGNTGIRYNHSGNEKIYVIERSRVNRLDGHNNSFSASSTKESTRHMWSAPKALPPNAGMIGRLLNADDDLAASIQVNVIYGD